MLLQIDGSRHDWLEGRGHYLTLVEAIDDATGNVPYALFRDEEDAQGYFLLLRQIVANYGIPGALYHDGHGIFERSRKEADSIRVIPGKTHSNELAVSAIVAKKTSRPKPHHRTKPAPDHPWRRPFKVHLDRG